MIDALLMVLLFLTSVFLILLVLVQRGRGGGLAGAFGGLGGQSAFGTKAGDLFTRITIGVAAFWILLCAASVKYFGEENRGLLAPNFGKNSSTATEDAGGTTKKTDKATGSGKAAPAKSATGTAPKSQAAESAPASSAPAGATPAEQPAPADQAK